MYKLLVSSTIVALPVATVPPVGRASLCISWADKFDKNKAVETTRDWYIFNSHWNYEKFRYMFDLPTHKCHVIKNGVNNFPVRTEFKEGNRVRMLFHVTPWRGLNVLLGAMSLLKDCNVEVDVFSSCKIYGEDFANQNSQLKVTLDIISISSWKQLKSNTKIQ